MAACAIQTEFELSVRKLADLREILRAHHALSLAQRLPALKQPVRDLLRPVVVERAGAELQPGLLLRAGLGPAHPHPVAELVERGEKGRTADGDCGGFLKVREVVADKVDPGPVKEILQDVRRRQLGAVALVERFRVRVGRGVQAAGRSRLQGERALKIGVRGQLCVRFCVLDSEGRAFRDGEARSQASLLVRQVALERELAGLAPIQLQRGEQLRRVVRDVRRVAAMLLDGLALPGVALVEAVPDALRYGGRKQGGVAAHQVQAQRLSGAQGVDVTSGEREEQIHRDEAAHLQAGTGRRSCPSSS